MFTMIAIERNSLSKKSPYVAVKNNTYVKLAEELDIKHSYYCSASSTGNVCKCLCWLAYEQRRYKFILSIVKLAADIEFPLTVSSGSASSVAAGPVPNSLKRTIHDVDPAVAVDPGPAAAVVAGPAKQRRRQTWPLQLQNQSKGVIRR